MKKDVDGREVGPGHFGYVDYDDCREWWIVDVVEFDTPKGPCITCHINGRGAKGSVCGRDYRYNLHNLTFVGEDKVPDEVLALYTKRVLEGW